MKKKVKKIPKFKDGGLTWKDMSNDQRWNAGIEAVGAIGNTIGTAMSGLNVTLGGAISSAGSLAATGFKIGGPIGAGVGAAAGLIAGTAGRKNSVNENSTSTSVADIAEEGSGWMKWFGMSEEEMMAKANRIANANISEQMTEQIRSKYAMNPNNPNGGTILAAEGGIMRKPVDALVSKGELIYDPTTKKLRQVPGSKGKPNKADDVFARLYEGDVVISNSPTMLMANGKTPALNLMGMVDKYATGGTVKAREAIIKKVVNWLEANKTKPQEYAMYSGGTNNVKPYGYNKNLETFEYWDKDKKEYKKEYLDWVNNLTEQDVKDIFKGDYGDMSTYKGVNANYIPTVEEARKLMTDKKYGDWHKIGKAVVDSKIKNAEPKLAEPWQAKMSINGVGPLWLDMYKSNYPIDYTVTPIDMKLKTLPNPSAADGSRAARKFLARQNSSDWLDNISGILPTIGALFNKPDYHRETVQISPAQFVPVDANINPIRRAANESYAMARYNQSNIGPNTGAGMAYGLQAATNRAKTLTDAYVWQQDAQNKLIAQNAGIYNDWAKRYDAARYQAIADTRANEGAAQQMRDSAIRDAYEFMAGRRNDRMRLAMMEPLAKYAFDDDTYKKIYSRTIV